MEDLSAASLDDVKGWFTHVLRARRTRCSCSPATSTRRRRGRRSSSTSATSRRARRSRSTRRGSPSARASSARSCRTASRRRASTWCGTCRSGARPTRTSSAWPPTCSRPARRRASTSGWSTTSRSRRTSTAALDAREIASQFYVMATARPGVDLAKVEHAIREELAALAQGRARRAAELERVKTQRRAAFIRGVERIGGFGGKSDVLAQGEVFTGNPESYQVTQKRVAERHAGRGARRGRPLAVGRRLRARGAAVPRVRDDAVDGRSLQGADARRLAGRAVPEVRARHARERHEARRGRAAVRAAGQLHAARRLGLRGRPAGAAGHGEPGPRHDGRGHDEPLRPPDLRGAGGAGRDAGPRRRPRHGVGRTCRRSRTSSTRRSPSSATSSSTRRSRPTNWSGCGAGASRRSSRRARSPSASRSACCRA